MGYTILSLITLIVGFIYILKIQRDTDSWIENVVINKEVGDIPVERMYSQRKYYGGHGAGWGGGNVKNHIKFSYNNVNYLHKTPFVPLVLRMDKELFYLVYYDRETDIQKPNYKFYKSTKEGEFKEIKATEFPKHLAIQNLYWNKSDIKSEELIGLVPKKLKNTKTAYLWYLIEGKPEKYSWDTREEFIKEYKEKYITSRAEN